MKIINRRLYKIGIYKENQMNKIEAVFKENSKWKPLFMSILMMAIGYGLHKGIVDNYLAEVVGMKEFDRGATEFFRELPGFMLIFISQNITCSKSFMEPVSRFSLPSDLMY